MKKLILILACCLLLTACTTDAGSETTASPTETTAAAPSTAIIPETTMAQETTAAPETTEANAETEVTSVTIPDSPVEPETTGLTTFTLYTPNENADGFIAQEVQGEKLTPMEVLIEAGVLTEDVQLNEVKWENTLTLLTIDFNEAFRDMVLSQGTAGERMLIGSVVNTFLSAYQMEQIMITIDGGILESGHVVYDFPMGYFE